MIADGVLQQAAKELADLVQEKNRAYGDSFEKSGEILKILMPNGCPPEKFQDMLTVARITDKLFRICTDPTAFGEEPYKDIAGYALLSVVSKQKKELF